MSKIKNGWLDQDGAGPFKPQQFGTAGVEGVNYGNISPLLYHTMELWDVYHHGSSHHSGGLR